MRQMSRWDEYRWRFEDEIQGRIQGAIPRILRYSCSIPILMMLSCAVDRLKTIRDHMVHANGHWSTEKNAKVSPKPYEPYEWWRVFL